MTTLQILITRTLLSLILTIITVQLTSTVIWFNAIVIFLLIFLVVSDIGVDIEEYLRNRNFPKELR